jgi:hypothetical protein
MSEKRLNRRVAALQKKLDALQLFTLFVKNHPALHAYTDVGHYEGTSYLRFEERGYIKAVWHKEQERPVLRLERHITDDMNPADRIVSEDVSKLSDDELAQILKEGIKVDLSKPPLWEEGDDDL